MTSDSELTLSGDGLLRRGSPVVLVAPHPSLEGTDQACMAWTAERDRPRGSRRAVVLAVDGGGRVLIATSAAVMWAWLADAALDLTDATGRAHAAWWLARHYTVTRSPYDCVFSRVNGGWVLRCGYSDLAVWTYEQLGVDPEDRRSLPDGSSWLDAEALRIVAERAP